MFSVVKRIDRYRSVSIEELPGGGIVITGTTYNPHKDTSSRDRIAISFEAAKEVRVALQEFEKARGKE